MKHIIITLLFACLAAHAGYDPDVLPKGREYFELRDGLANCRIKFEREKTGRIAFLGGSITASGGWRDHTIKYFQQKYPATKFDFISAGIGSMGSVPHAFRLERDVLSHGLVDPLFVEAAVNDASNIPDHPEQMLRGTEPGAEFEFEFDGTGCGLFIAAGPDEGRIESSIDGSEYRLTETFTRWNTGLHLPWALILDDGLKDGHHTVKVRIAEGHDAKGAGTALRVFHLLLN